MPRIDRWITGIAVSADSLYFGIRPVEGRGAIYAMPLSGGAPTVLVGDVPVSELRLDGDTLYYVSGRGTGFSSVSLRAIPTTGGTPTELFQAEDITDVTPDPSGVYFEAHWPDRYPEIMHTGRDGTGARIIKSHGGTPGFAVDDENIYWATYPSLVDGALFRRPLSGGIATTLLSSMDVIKHPISDGFDIAFVQQALTTDACRGALMSIPKSGGAPIKRTSLGTSGHDVIALARDETHLYWSSTGVHGAVLHAQRGQTAEIIAADQPNPSPPVLGPKDVYWIVHDGWMHEVRTVPK